MLQAAQVKSLFPTAVPPTKVLQLVIVMIYQQRELNVNAQTLDRHLNKKVDRQTAKIVLRAEHKIKKSTLTAICEIVTPKIEVALRSNFASTGGNATSVITVSESRVYASIVASYENVSQENNTIHE